MSLRLKPSAIRRGRSWHSFVVAWSLATFFIVASATTEPAAAEPGGEETAVDFAHEIVPILRTHCGECHVGDHAEGGFSMNARSGFDDAGAAVPGDPDASYFLELIRSDDTDLQMPPPEHPRVPDAQVQTLVRWVRQDMPWTEGLRLDADRYVVPLGLRTVMVPAGPGHPIDRLLSNYRSCLHLAEPQIVDRETFLRRSKLDLLGLLPTAADRDRLPDMSIESRRRWVRDLLDRDIDYADHWLTFFNDLFRNDYTGTGFITGGRKQISGWLYEALRRNQPYDSMARDLVAPPTPQSAGFIDGIRWRGDVSAAQSVEVQFAGSVAQSFLGINLKCASCHDSFIDRWTLQEAYELAAVYADKPLDIYRCDKPTGQTAVAGWLYPELGTIDPDDDRAARLKALAGLMTDPGNGRFARTIVNRVWGRMMGRGLVHPLDAMGTAPWNEDLLDFLASWFVENGYDLRALMHFIATSRTYASAVDTAAASGEVPEDFRDIETAMVRLNGSAATDDSGSTWASMPRADVPRPKRLTSEQFLDAVWDLCGTHPDRMAAPVLRVETDPGDRGPVGNGPEPDLAVREVDWIWGRAKYQESLPGEAFTFEGKLSLASPVRRAVVVASVDNRFRLFLNRRLVLQGNTWDRPSAAVIDAKWKSGKANQGENVLHLEAVNGGENPGPAGAWLWMQVEHVDGSVTRFGTGDHWKAGEGTVTSRENRVSKLPPFDADAFVIEDWGVYRSRREAFARVVQNKTSESSRPIRASLIANTPLMRSLGRPGREQIVSSRPEELTTVEAMDLSTSPELSGWISTGAAKRLLSSDSTVQYAHSLYFDAFTRRATYRELNVLRKAFGEDLNQDEASDLLWAVLMSPEFWLVP